MVELKHFGQSGKMAEYKLTYFNIEGIAEPLRFLFKYGNIPFVDERLTSEEWKKIKAESPTLNLPLLEYKGKVYVQHMAMCRYLGDLVGLSGKTALENLEIDGAVDTITDLRIKLVIWYLENDRREARRTKVLTEIIPYYFKVLQRRLESNDGYLACKRLTWADLYFTAILDTLDFYYEGNIVEDYPVLNAHKQRILSIPSLKKWLQERPKPDMVDVHKLVDYVKSKRM